MFFQSLKIYCVSKFAKDNEVYFEFYPHLCIVKSQATNEVLLKGINGSDDFYSLPSLKLQESFIS